MITVLPYLPTRAAPVSEQHPTAKILYVGSPKWSARDWMVQDAHTNRRFDVVRTMPAARTALQLRNEPAAYGMTPPLQRYSMVIFENSPSDELLNDLSEQYPAFPYLIR